MSSYEKLPQEAYDKAVGQFRLAVGEVLSVFKMYGMGAYIGGAIEEIVDLAEKFGMRVRKKDIAISLEYKRNARR